LSPFQRRGCHVDGDSGVNQTLTKKSLEEENLATEPAKQCQSSLQKAAQRLSGEVRSKASHRIASERFHVKSTSSQNAAYDAAERRWNVSLMMQFKAAPDVFAGLIDAIDSGLQRATTELELRKPGSGLSFLLGVLDRRVPLGDSGGVSAVAQSTVPSSDLLRAGNSDRDGSPAPPDFQSLKSLNSEPKEEPKQ
jgi:hypothetical protein